MYGNQFVIRFHEEEAIRRSKANEARQVLQTL